MGFIEEIGEDLGLFLSPMQPFPRGCLHRLAIARSRLSHHALDVAVEQLIGIQIRRIARQKEQLNALRMLAQPSLHSLCAMRWMAIDDQKYFAPRVLDQPLAELDELIGTKASFEYHEAHLPLVGQRRDDMTNAGGKLALMWDKTIATVPFKAGT